VRLHGSPVQFHQAAHERKPDAEASMGAFDCRIGLSEHFKYHRQRPGRNTDSGVAYAQHGFVAFARDVQCDAPDGVNLAALFSRLEMTCDRRAAPA
jgi:hypothetical protein